MSGTEESELLSWVGTDLQAMPRSEGGVALCGACLPKERCRLGITEEKLLADDVLVSNLTCPPDHEGGPSVAHGGWTASVMDEMLGHVPLAHNQLSVTATITVDFKKPVPIERPLQVRAWIDRIEGRKWFITGELVLLSSEAVLATATGLWIARDVSHFSQHQAWLAEQDASAAQSS
ncbi:MAG: PaaI family thioesterase [Mycobacterium sp.]